MKTAMRIILGILASVFLLVVVAFLLWFFKPKKELDVFILDKTVPTMARSEHQSFHWVLNHERYVKNNRERYKLKEDYHGFFPTSSEKEQFDFKSLSIRDVERISNQIDFAYYADTYGVYYNDWYHKPKTKIRSEQKVYGGLNQNDYLLLKELIEKGKTIVTEFVLLDKTTSPLVRKKTEELLEFSWDGWLGRYFHSLDTVKNPRFPSWIVNFYKKQNGGSWPFKHSGIVLIHKYGKIVVLDSEKHLTKDRPIIHTEPEFADKYQVPRTIEYPYWFDMMKPDNQEDVAAHFELPVNGFGDSLLSSYGVSKSFPAIIHQNSDYKLFYFAGDFCQNPIYTKTSYLTGIEFLDFVFYPKNKADHARFFWKYYSPLMEGILEDTFSKLN